MSRLIDLTGQRFGNLSVIERYNPGGTKRVYWACKCDCGRITTVAADKLRSCHTKSCGCLTKSALLVGFDPNGIGKNWYLYLLISESNETQVVYVGVTKNPIQRLNQHKNRARINSRNNQIYDAMRKNGVDDVQMLILREYIEKRRALKDEALFIRNLADECCNIAKYGSSKGVKRSAALKERHSQTMKKHFQDEEYKKRWKETSWYGFIRRSDEVERRRIETLRSPEHRDKVSKQVSRYFKKPGNRLKASLAKQIRVYKTPYGEFHSSSYAAKAAKVTPKTVLNRCNSKDDRFADWIMQEINKS